MTFDQEEDGGLRLVYLEDYFIALLAHRFIEGERYDGPAFIDLPKDMRVLTVHYEHQRKAFAVTCQSKEWSVIPCGVQIPEIEVERFADDGSNALIIWSREDKRVILPAADAVRITRLKGKEGKKARDAEWRRLWEEQAEGHGRS